MVNDMKKDKKKNIIKCILFFIIFCVLMGVLSVVFYPKTSDPEGGLSNPNARGFYGEPRNSLDVVVMGNSNAYSAYSPMMMWKNYGIPTYVAAEGAQNIAETVNVLQEVSKSMAEELGREAKLSELAERMKMTEDEVREIMKVTMDALSMSKINQDLQS